MNIEELKAERERLNEANDQEIGARVGRLKDLLDDLIRLHEVVQMPSQSQYSPEAVLSLSAQVHELMNHEKNVAIEMAEVAVGLRKELTAAERNLQLNEHERRLHHAHQARWLNDLEELRQERDRLKVQIHDMCHDSHVTNPGISREEFCDGCEQFQVQKFGSSPITELRQRLKEIVEACRMQTGATVGGFAQRILNIAGR